MPFEIPEGWCWCTVGGIVYDLKYGTSKKSSALGDVPVLRMGNLTRKGTISYDNLVYTSDLSDIAEYELTKGDLLFNRTNSSDWVGKTALYDGKVKSIYAGYLVRVRAIIVNSEYLNIVMNSQYYRDWCFSVKTDAVNQSNINANKLASFSVPIPPLTEQNRIVREVMKMTELVEQIEQGVLDIQSFIGDVKAKILDLAIHGKLVPQDPNDEPASELLKRINPKAVASCDNPQYGKVPSSWVISTVGETFTINPKTHVEDDTEAAFVPMTCVADGYSNTFEYECRKWGDIKKGFVHFQENDVAVAKISPCLENRKSVVFHNLPNGIGAGTTELNVFRCGEILPEYALFYFKSPMFIGSCAGTYNGVVGQQRVAKSFIQELPIGIPPYKEQLRIVSKVNELFSQLDMIEKSLQA